MKLVVCLSSALYVLGQSCVTVQHATSGQAGDGVTFPKVGDTVTMHYTGTLTNGQKFDSSRDRGTPFTTKIGVGQVIQGWDEGVPQLSLGERATLRISATCGYGAAGSPPAIPPSADLVFDVQLLAINGQSTSAAAAPRAPATSPLSQIAQRPLPTCQPSSCGMGLTGSSSSATPVCSCDASCLRGTLPCCPSFREVCNNNQGLPVAQAPPVQNSFPSFSGGFLSQQGSTIGSTQGFLPQQSSTLLGGATFSNTLQGNLQSPTLLGQSGAAFSGFQGTTMQGSLSTTLGGNMQSSLPQLSQALPQAAPAPQNVFSVSTFGLPECIASSCGNAMTPPSGGRPVCLCNPMCEMMKGTPGVLPCCPKIQEVCLDPWRSPSPAPPATQNLAAPQSLALQTPTTLPAPLFVPQQTFSSSAWQFQTAKPVAQQVAAPAFVGAQIQTRSAPLQSAPLQSAPLQGSFVLGAGLGSAPKSAVPPPVAVAPAAAPKSLSPACQFGSTKWAEQPSCDEKRWAIQGGKCKKVCDAVQLGSGVQYYPKTDDGKAACQAALSLCGLP